jgi:hypothetical protein
VQVRIMGSNYVPGEKKDKRLSKSDPMVQCIMSDTGGLPELASSTSRSACKICSR